MDRQTALVTGSNGFVGSHLCERLVGMGYHVKALVRTTSNLQFIENLDVELVYGELSNPESLRPALENIDLVFHPAGLVRARDEKTFMRVNRIGTRNLLEAAIKSCPNLKRFVHISSQAAAGPSDSFRPVTENDTPAPVSAYGRSKLASEEEVLEFRDRFPVIIIRPPAVYGPRDSDIYKFFKLARIGLNPRLGAGQKHISLVHVSDLVECIITAANNEKAIGEIFFAANSQANEYNALVHMMADIMKCNIIDIVIPPGVAKWLAAVIETVTHLLRKPAPLSRDKIAELSQDFWLCSAQKAEDILGWKASIPVREGLKQTYRWYVEKKWL
jgi:nucleoside-diphosphate-sugar epimerase